MLAITITLAAVTLNRWPATEDLIAILSFVVIVAAGFVPSRREPDAPFLATQRWGYRDLIIIFGVITVIGLLPPPSVSVQTRVGLWAIINGSIAAFILASVWAVVRSKHRKPWRALGFDPATALYNTLWSLRIALGLASVLAIFALVVRSTAPLPHAATSGPPRAVWHGQLADFLAASFVTAVLGPVSEEAFFRGLAYGPLFRKFGAVGAAVGSAALWAAGHYSGASTGAFNVLSKFVLGIVYAEIYRRRESLVPTVIFHIVGNTAVVFLADRYFPALITFAGLSVGFWILSIVLFHVVSESRACARDAKPV